MEFGGFLVFMFLHCGGVIVVLWGGVLLLEVNGYIYICCVIYIFHIVIVFYVSSLIIKGAFFMNE